MLFLCLIDVISNDGIYTDFGISNAIFEQNQLQMTATLCIHQSSRNDMNLPDSKWNANDRFSTVGCVSGVHECLHASITLSSNEEEAMQKGSVPRPSRRNKHLSHSAITLPGSNTVCFLRQPLTQLTSKLMH